MHAALVTAKVQELALGAAVETIEKEAVPMVRSFDGFVAAYWLDVVDGEGLSIVVFDTEEHARQGTPSVGAPLADGVVVAKVEYRGVAVSC